MEAPLWLKPWRWSRFALALGAIVLVGFGIRVAYIVVDTPTTVDGDAVYYHLAGNLLADGKGYIDPIRYNYEIREEIPLPSGETRVVVTPVGTEVPTAIHPPAYAAYLGAFSTLGFRTVRGHQFASALLGAASILLAGLLGRSIANARVGLIAAALTATYANIWINDGLVMSETIAIFFAFLTSLIGLRFWRRPTFANAVWLGVVGALAALSRIELILFLPIVGAAALLRSSLPWPARLGRFAVVGVVAVAVLSPWVIRNNIVMNKTVTISDGSGTVLVQANCDATYYGPNIGSWSMPCGDPWPYSPEGGLLDESERDAVVSQRGTEYMSQHKTRLVTVVAPARVARMWGLLYPFQQIRIEIGEGRPPFASWLGFWSYLFLVPFAVAGAVIQWRRKQPVLVVGLWVIVVTITAASAFGNTRYRTAAEISIVIFAAIAFDALPGLVGRIRERSNRRSASPLPA